MEPVESEKPKSSARKRADTIKDFRCKNLIAVIEDPENPRNIGTAIRNVNALGGEKVYVIDPRRVLPDDWDDLRADPKLSKLSVSAVKWTFVKRFDSTEQCLDHLEKNHFVSMVTSPHVKGKTNTLLHEADFTEHAKLAIWFGNESKALLWQKCDSWDSPSWECVIDGKPAFVEAGDGRGLAAGSRTMA